MAAKKTSKKVKTLPESKVADAYEVVNGFNYPDGKGGETRVNAGNAIVFEKDFEPSVWKELLKLRAVQQVAPVEALADGESVAAEVIQ